MTANGFLEQRQASPFKFGTVLALHGVAIAAVILLKGPGFIRADDTTTTVIQIDKEKPPPPIEPLPRTETAVRTPQRSIVDTPIPEIITPPTGPTQPFEGLTAPAGPTVGTGPVGGGGGTSEVVPPRDPPRDPVRTASLFDPRFAGSQQPPYPPSEERAEREGQVRVRVTIGPDGRVTAASQVSATNEAFWRATERQALSRWRFRPATVDGRPVQDSKVITIYFRLDGR